METFWAVTSLSFIVALSGAMAPGPLLTYTIIKTLQSPRKGYLVGARVILGHSLLEALLIVAILLGLSPLLSNPLAVRIIGVLGSGFLLFLGGSLIRDVIRGKAAAPLDRDSSRDTGNGEARGTAKIGSVWGGVLISMSNPYWWLWWASIGFAFMLRYDVSFSRWPLLLGFFIGHEGGDLAWYVTVSTLVYLGRSRIDDRIYRVVLLLCAVVMIGLGGYLGVSAFFYRS